GSASMVGRQRSRGRAIRDFPNLSACRRARGALCPRTLAGRGSRVAFDAPTPALVGAPWMARWSAGGRATGQTGTRRGRGGRKDIEGGVDRSDRHPHESQQLLQPLPRKLLGAPFILRDQGRRRVTGGSRQVRLTPSLALP